MSERDRADTYEVFAVRYGTRTTSKAEAYLNWSVYGEPDETFDMDYFFWVIQNPWRTVVLDCGFDPEVGRQRGRTVLVDPVEALAALGINAANVERLVVSHAHYDHIGTLDRFPSAEVVMTRRELEFWRGPHATRAQFAHPTEPAELAVLAEAHVQGRVTTFDGSLQLAPGIDLVEVGGHTPGQLIALVQVDRPNDGMGTAVLAADALHFYDELDQDRPFFVVADLEAMYEGFDRLRALAEGPGRMLVAGHDASVVQRFPGRARGTGIDELIVRVDTTTGGTGR